jgi:hypothetical protein
LSVEEVDHRRSRKAGAIDSDRISGLVDGESAHDRERFANLKAEYYLGLRERFQEGQISGLMDDTTIGEPATIMYKQTATGKTQIESKDEARTRVREVATYDKPACYGSFVSDCRLTQISESAGSAVFAPRNPPY